MASYNLSIYSLLFTITTVCSSNGSSEFYTGKAKITYEKWSSKYNKCMDVIEEDCCQKIYKQHTSPPIDLFYFQLAESLHDLTELGCPQQKTACKSGFFKIDKFTEKVYTMFCDSQSFLEECEEEFVSIQEENTTNIVDVIENYIIKNQTFVTYLSPCVAAASFYGSANYIEIPQVRIPFCDYVWTGMDERIIEKFHPLLYTYLSISCITNLTICAVFAAFLGIAITIGNFAIIIIIMFYTKEKSGNDYCRLSLAIGDIFMGIIVIPLSLIFHVTYYWHTPIHAPVPTKQGQAAVSLNGFFNIFSFAISFYTLLVAALDCFLKVWKPLSYGSTATKRMVKFLLLIVWIGSFIYALLPIVLTYHRYKIDRIGMTSLTEGAMKWSLAPLIAIPLIILWILNITIIKMAKRQLRRALNSVHIMQRDNEIRMDVDLSITLIFMSASVTVCILYAIIGLSFNFYNTFDHSVDILSNGTFRVRRDFAYSGIFVAITNSLWNIFIYNFRDRKFRKQFQKVFLCKN